MNAPHPSEPARLSLWAETRADFVFLLLGAFHCLRERLPLLVLSTTFVLGGIALLWSQDGTWTQAGATFFGPEWKPCARSISFWGDFPTGICWGFILLSAAGLVFRRRDWRRLALAAVLGAALAGINANLISFSTGRPRPSENLPDGFYGFQTKLKFRSFPSGHTATGFGTATVLAVAVPELALPAYGVATAIAWSRLYLRRHYVTDLILGAFLGLVWGGAVGWTYRRLPPA